MPHTHKNDASRNVAHWRGQGRWLDGNSIQPARNSFRVSQVIYSTLQFPLSSISHRNSVEDLGDGAKICLKARM